MKRIYRTNPSTISVLIVVVFSGIAFSAPIYSQLTPAQPIGAFSSNDAGNPTDQKIADNFVITGAAATVRSLRFIGGYGLTSPPPSTPPLNALPTDAFRVVFFTDSGGAPGMPLIGGDFHVGAAVRRTPTAGPLLNGIYMPLEYQLDLGTGIALDPSTVYWMSIVNDPGANYFWDWARAGSAFDQSVASKYGDILSGPWEVFPHEGGMFFELSDRNVPEPSAVGMLLAGLLGMLWIRLIHLR